MLYLFSKICSHLQKAIFGDVFEATGLTTGRRFAVKALELDLVRRFEKLQQEDHQFCESPLSEIKFSTTMSGLEHVVQLEDHLADDQRHYIVSELATGGDLLEALRAKPGGFSEDTARTLMMGAAKGLASLHARGLAMQDVSVENMLIYELPNKKWQVKVCDPGQAIIFELDNVTGEEERVEFHGFVGKEFRPPELYNARPYKATKVDAWCLGWSTFYILTAQAMFQSADPAAGDEDWELFKSKAFPKLFKDKGWRQDVSAQAKDFVLRLMDLNPEKRMSVHEALEHPWIATIDASTEQRSRTHEPIAATPPGTNATTPVAGAAAGVRTTSATTDGSFGDSSGPSQTGRSNGVNAGPVLLRKLGSSRPTAEPGILPIPRKVADKARTDRHSLAGYRPQPQVGSVPKKAPVTVGAARPAPRRFVA